jgi:hypothetical protein
MRVQALRPFQENEPVMHQCLALAISKRFSGLFSGGFQGIRGVSDHVKLVNNDLGFRKDASDGITVGLPHIHADDLYPVPLRHVPQIFRNCRCITVWQ